MTGLQRAFAALALLGGTLLLAQLARGPARCSERALVLADKAAAGQSLEAATGASGGVPEAAAPPEGPPYRLPRLIHQTVRDKRALSCEQKRVIASWKRLNPGFTHRLWDDADMREFMVKFYPELVPTPFDDLLSGTERSDLWRILVLHKLGGVYADIDVQCLRPIDEWNAERGHDASLLLGLENYEADRPQRLHVVNWALAAVPGHPLLARLPGVVARVTQRQYFEAARRQAPVTREQYEDGVLDRTGPAALSVALYEHFASLGVDLNKFSEADAGRKAGIIAGGARILPVVALASGWELAQARQAQTPYSCEDVAREKPGALVCHMFWGSWRSRWSFKQEMTYGNCGD